MIQALSVAGKSLVQEPIKHVGNVAGTGTAVVVAPDYLAIATGVVGLLVSIGIGVHTYIKIKNDMLETKIRQAEWAKIDRREEDK